MADYRFVEVVQEMRQDIRDIKAALAALSNREAELAALKQQVTDLVAQHVVDVDARNALQAGIDDVFPLSESVKGELRGLAAHPAV